MCSTNYFTHEHKGRNISRVEDGQRTSEPEVNRRRDRSEHSHARMHVRLLTSRRLVVQNVIGYLHFLPIVGSGAG